eukprot:CAMPEP_0119263194 /NCGR_PEP_ID=MMETSP1329-20130426/2679_1 /TAXON_ID=114041 /ORGANISM="Genus nov. species nov., Strain RCC1024" /LENGTH=350 /DNA_ID=CAMNT_0007262893 /DNA_START=99 /DNA_END=1147 /DNA_ORIENTATION=+
MASLMETDASQSFDDVAKDASVASLGKQKTCVLFGAPWDDASAQLRELLAESAKRGSYPTVTLRAADAEECEDLSDALGVEAVPTLVLLDGGAKVKALEAPGAADVHDALQEFDSLQTPPGLDAGEEAAEAERARLELRLKNLIRGAPGMLFMKGNPEAPRCGFSRQVCELLRGAGVAFETFDILGDDEVRQGLKKFSDWPTYPQFYANGELVGGLDILREMNDEGDLKGQLALAEPEPAEPPEDDGAAEAEALNARLAALIRTQKCMLFMKGSPGDEKCGFSRTFCGLLKEHGIEYGSFDILTDNDVRQGLKKYSDWPTFPQFYVDGELIGGLDIMKEMAEDGDLKGQL